jgi:hypothetical protein
MDRLDELAIFVAIIDTGSLAGAARQLRRSRPAVTRALAALEERAGVRLIARTTRQLMATRGGTGAGRPRPATSSRSMTHRLSGVTAAPMRGLIRITAPTAFGRRHVTPVVAEFPRPAPGDPDRAGAGRSQSRPDRGGAASCRPASVRCQVSRLVGAQGRRGQASAGRGPPPICSAGGIPRRPADLAGHDTIVSIAAGQSMLWRFAGDARSATVQVAPRLIVNEIESVLIAARSRPRPGAGAILSGRARH